MKSLFPARAGIAGKGQKIMAPFGSSTPNFFLWGSIAGRGKFGKVGPAAVVQDDPFDIPQES